MQITREQLLEMFVGDEEQFQNFVKLIIKIINEAENNEFMKKTMTVSRKNLKPKIFWKMITNLTSFKLFTKNVFTISYIYGVHNRRRAARELIKELFEGEGLS